MHSATFSENRGNDIIMYVRMIRKYDLVLTIISTYFRKMAMWLDNLFVATHAGGIFVQFICIFRELKREIKWINN